MFADEFMSPIKSDERVIFFPTAATFDGNRQQWVIPVHGWIFEPEEDDLLRKALLRELREELDFADANESKILQDRLRLFLVDNERNKQIPVRIAGGDHLLPPSGPDGHFTDTLRLPAAAVRPALASNRLDVHAITRPGDLREFCSSIYCLPPTGVSVVSDVDDTIKVSAVRNRRELLANTFLRPFRPVDGMSAAYQRWAAAGAHFHYVSAMPWQLYSPLAEFIEKENFPAGVYQLKRFRLKDSGLRELFANRLQYKLATIEPILTAFSQRSFILVGDSGEQDPEAYGELARRYPDQIERIYIRNITNEPASAPRYQQAFANVPVEKWRLFESPAELPEKLDVPSPQPATR